VDQFERLDPMRDEQLNANFDRTSPNHNNVGEAAKITGEMDISDSKAFKFFNEIGGDESADGVDMMKSVMKLNVKGIGISLVDHEPREICYISIYEPQIVQFLKYSLNKQGIEKTRRKLDFKLVNM